MNADETTRTFLEFFEERGHQVIEDRFTRDEVDTSLQLSLYEIALVLALSIGLVLFALRRWHTARTRPAHLNRG